MSLEEKKKKNREGANSKSQGEKIKAPLKKTIVKHLEIIAGTQSSSLS